MAYDEKLAERIRGVIPLDRDIVERKMFGGIAFLVDGKMFVGVTNDDLMAVAAWVKRAMAFVDPLVASKSRTRRPRPRLKVRRT